MIVGRGWENETRPPVFHHRRPLTHSLDLTEEGLAMKATCSIDGCDKPSACRGWCSMHASRWYRHGDTMHVEYTGLQDLERFWLKVEKTDTCWNWTGSSRPCKSGNYGQMSWGGKFVSTHLISYRLHVGPVPEGLWIDHICHNTLCVRPDHLRAVTPGQNQQNRRGAQRNSSTGIRGVVKRPSGRWQAKVQYRGQTHTNGTWATVEEAEAAAVELRNRLFTHNDRDRQETPDAAVRPVKAPVRDEHPTAGVLTPDDPPAPALLPDPRIVTDVPF